jgi:hypothetical protein
MRRTAIAAALVAALVAAPAAEAAQFLTIREAQRAARAHLRQADELNEVTYREVGPCWRVRRHIVDCEFFEEGVDFVDEFEFRCEGYVRVRETRTSYQTRGRGVDCS